MTDRDPPDGWHWGLGNTGPTHYTYWLYTDQREYDDGWGWEAQAYCDGGEHHVQFLPIKGITSAGDPVFDYPSHQESFKSEQRAIEYLVEKAAELR